MAHKQRIRSYCNPFPPRFSAAVQLARLAGELYTEDKKGKIIDALIRAIRPGDVVEVVELFLLAPVKASTAKRRRVLVERIEAIKARGGSICEVSTGDRSDQGHLPRMIVRAVGLISKGGKGAAGRTKRGRPKKERASEDLQIMEFEWVSKRNKTIADVLVAVRNRGIKRATVSEFYRHFGSRIAGKAGE